MSPSLNTMMCSAIVVAVACLNPLDAPAMTDCTGGSLIAHGEVRFVDVEGGCWQFTADGGTNYELFDPPAGILVDGNSGTLRGCLRPDLASFCQVGQIVEVDEFDSDGCASDIVGADDEINFDDLAMMLGCWGAVSPGCEVANIMVTGSSIAAVDFDDLSALLGAWGPCPTE